MMGLTAPIGNETTRLMFRGAQERFDSFCPAASLVLRYFRFLVQHRVQERAMNFDLPVIGYEAELAKLIHEKADTGTCCADHFRQRFLADVRRDGLWGTFLSEICQEKEKPRESGILPGPWLLKSATDGH
jgi:hypothetical protein